MSTLVVLNIFNAVALLFLTSLGLAIVFGLMGVVNLAHGTFIMLGAYTVFYASTLKLSPWLGLLMAPVVVGIFGFFIERLLVRRIYGQIMQSILATFGLSIVLGKSVEFIFGKGYKPVPELISQSVSVFGTSYPLYRLFIIAVAILLFVLLLVIQRGTNLGVTIRAVIANPELASSLGVNINRVYQGTFIVGCALAGLAGGLLAPLVVVHANMGLDYLINAFMAVLLGAGSLVGLAGSTALLGGSSSLMSYWADAVWGNILILVLAIAFMKRGNP
jgi:urea transport system permease protein